MKVIPIYQVDAFSEKPFGGNPAGVIIDANKLSEEEMQNIAKEMNLSETAFITGRVNDCFHIRFFTPTCEVDLCGHATIATFHTLCKLGYIETLNSGRKTVYQETKVGKLAVEIRFKEGEIEGVFMEQSAPKELGPLKDIEQLCKIIGIKRDDVGVTNNMVNPEMISTGLADIILPIKDKDVLDNLDIDMRGLSKISKKLGVVGIHVFHLPKINSDIVYTRNFAPLVGIDEESATGTSNGGLIYFLKKNGLITNNEIVSYQGQSMNRPSVIHCKIENTSGSWLVKVGGKAVIVIKGKIFI